MKLHCWNTLHYIGSAAENIITFPELWTYNVTSVNQLCSKIKLIHGGSLAWTLTASFFAKSANFLFKKISGWVQILLTATMHYEYAFSSVGWGVSLVHVPLLNPTYALEPDLTSTLKIWVPLCCFFWGWWQGAGADWEGATTWCHTTVLLYFNFTSSSAQLTLPCSNCWSHMVWNALSSQLYGSASPIKSYRYCIRRGLRTPPWPP